ncbi:MAG: hypothetical protein ACMUIM_01660 [bacterium]
MASGSPDLCPSCPFAEIDPLRFLFMDHRPLAAASDFGTINDRSL